MGARKRDQKRRVPGAGSHWKRLAAAGGAALAALVASAAARAADDGSEPGVALDQLLKLPATLDVAPDRREGATPSQWRARFQTGRARLSEARAAVQRSQHELEGLAETSDSWQIAPPGATDPTPSPLSYRLRQEIRRQREEVAHAKQQLKDLQIEANLADVPDAWRQ